MELNFNETRRSAPSEEPVFIGRRAVFMAKYIKRVVPNSLIRRRLDYRAGNGVMLTFDDGPTSNTTPVVLDVLAKYEAKATFFIVGKRIEKNPGVLQRLLEKGHVLANHTFQHPSHPIVRMVEYRNDILQCQELIEKETGIVPRLFRPPGGRITVAGLLAARSAGLSSVFWSNDGGENSFNKGKGAEYIANLVISQLKPKDLILFHDDCPDTPEILERVLMHLRNESIDIVNGEEYLIRPGYSHNLL